MAAHSSALAWRLPAVREPGGMPSMGSHRVGHDEAMKRLNSSSSSKARNLVLCVISPDFDVFTERHLGMNEEDKRQVLSLGCRFAAGASSKEPACQSRRLREASVMPGPGRSPGGGRGDPLQCSCLENPMDRGAWRPAVRGVPQSRTRLK